MRRILVVAFACIFILVACEQTSEVVSPPEPTISLSIANLPHLEHDDGHYELWATFLDFNKSAGEDGLMHDEGFMSLGQFNFSELGEVVDLDGNPMRFVIPAGEDVQLLDDVIITVGRHIHEPGSPNEPGPAIAGGKFYGDERTAIADISVSYVDAFGTNFSSVTGSYTLTAPSSVPTDSNSGVWFFVPNPTPAPGLRNLPSLPAGWTYEGWMVSLTTFHSTGKFMKADSADFDGAGPGKGPGSGLNFPGQDFIVGDPARPDLSAPGFSFMVTIEPSPDNSAAPFFLRLVSAGFSSWSEGTTISRSMENVAAQFAPSGRVTVKR